MEAKGESIMSMTKPLVDSQYLQEKILHAKKQFERTIECKHTEFDDLYPYMGDHPQFFWYKRYVAWTELLTFIKIANETNVEWKHLFSEKQIAFLEKKVLESKVLNEWMVEAPDLECI